MDRARARTSGRHRAAGVIVGAILLFTGCRAAPPGEHVTEEPVELEPVGGRGVNRIRLTANAARRLGIETAPVKKSRGSLVVPSAALIVDPNGVFWVYTNPEPLVFLRHEVGIRREEAGQAFLADGPIAGVRVVIVGVPELYGAETGVGH